MRRRPRRRLIAAGAAGVALAALGALLLVTLAGRLWPGDGRWVEIPYPAVRDWHGGFSAIEVNGDGTRALILSDRGYAVRARLIRDGAGRLNGLETGRYAALRNISGRTLRGTVDTEGLATPPGRLDGTAVVSLEWNHRLLAYDDLPAAPEGLPRRLPRPGLWRGLHGNAGPEAVAQRADGAILAIAEGTGPGGHPVALLRDGAWTTLAPLPAGGWAPVGADFGPRGALYLLERRFLGAGFRSRVRRFALGPQGLTEARTLLVTPLGRHGNLEGIAVWTNGPELRLTMIADDNFYAVQRGGLVEYALDRPGRGG